MTYTESPSPAPQATFYPVFGEMFNVSNPKELDKAVKRAEHYKNEARRIFEQSRSYLSQSTAKVNELKAMQVYGINMQVYGIKEACHG
jgi:hypothetical protein